MKTNFLRSFFAWGGMVALTFNAFLPGFVAYAENISGEETEAGVENTAPAADPQEPAADPEEPAADPEEPVADPQEPVADSEGDGGVAVAGEGQGTLTNVDPIESNIPMNIDAVLVGGNLGAEKNNSKNSFEVEDTCYFSLERPANSYTPVECNESEDCKVSVGEKKYKNLSDAVRSIQADGEEKTITLLGDVRGPGFIVNDNQNIVVDFGGYTYTVTDGVGSSGTERNGMQLLKGSKVTLKNGKFTFADTFFQFNTSTKICNSGKSNIFIAVQKYNDLVIENMDLDYSNLQADYVVSNNNGSTLIKGDTRIISSPNGVAFDLWYGMNKIYENGIEVVFDESFLGLVKGKVEYGRQNVSDIDYTNWREKTKLLINNGEFDITFASGSSVADRGLAGANIKISGGIFTSDPSDYVTDGNKVVYTNDWKYEVKDGAGNENSDFSTIKIDSGTVIENIDGVNLEVIKDADTDRESISSDLGINVSEVAGVVNLKFTDEDGLDLEESVKFSNAVLVNVPVSGDDSVRIKIKHANENFGIRGLATAATTCSGGIATNEDLIYKGDALFPKDGIVQIYVCEASEIAAVRLSSSVAVLNNTEYGTLEAAVSQAQNGDIIKLLTGVTLTDMLVIDGKDIELDLNGKTLTGTSSNGKTILLKKGNLKISNGTIYSNSQAINLCTNDKNIENYANLVIEEDVTIIGDYAIIVRQSNYANCGGSTVEKGYGADIEVAGKIISNNSAIWVIGSIKQGNNKVTIKDTAEITLNDKSGRTCGANSDFTALGAAGVCDWKIEGGDFEVTNGTIIEIKAGSLIIDTGNFVVNGPNNHIPCNGGSSTMGYAVVSVENGGYAGAESVKINGGIFTGAIGKVKDSTNTTTNSFKVSGGTFTSPVAEEYCADGFIPKNNGNGTFGVKEGGYVAQIVGGDKYETFEATYEAARAGDIITLLTGVTITGMVNIEKNITIDLNGKKLEKDDGNSIFQIISNATLTIDGTVTGSEVYGRINVGKATENNGKVVLSGGYYHCTNNQTVLHVNGDCKHSDVTIRNATIYSPSDNGIQLNGSGIHTITNSTIEGKTAVYVKSGKVTITGSTLRSNATIHTAYKFNGNGSNPTGDGLVVDTCLYPGGAPEVVLGAGNTITVASEENKQLGYYEYNTSSVGFAPADIKATSNTNTVTLGFAWRKISEGNYVLEKVFTYKFVVDGNIEIPFSGDSIISGDSVSAPILNPNKEGYEFTTWQISGTNDNATFPFVVTGDVVFNAILTPNIYKVHFNSGDATAGSMADQSFTYDKEQTLSEVSFTKEGYHFIQWTGTTLSGNTFADEANIKNLSTGADVTLYAEWAANEYTIKYDANSGTGTESILAIYDVDVTLSAGTAFSKTGYHFTGWDTNPAGTTVVYTGGETVKNLTGTKDATVTLYAVWEANTDTQYTVEHYQQNVNGSGYTLADTDNLTGTTDKPTAAVAKDYTGFTLSGNIATYQTTIAGDKSTVIKVYYDRNPHTLKYVVDGKDYLTGTVIYGADITAASNPSKDSCNQFAGWTSSVEGVTTSSTMPDSDVTFTATWNYTCSRSSGGGGSSRSSSDDMKEVVLGGEVEINTGDKAEINTGDENKLPENTDGNNLNGNDSNYDPELVAAYEWAYKNGITTMDTIEKARLNDRITRAELAKMMVVFMSGVLQKEPVITGNAGYKDVSEKGQGDLAGYIELAYQYQIMGINADGKALQNFNPNGKVSRAEFATVLSRVLYGSKYNQSGANYYELHIQALSEAKILKDTNPAIKEFRGWILLMLYRSQNGESNNNSEENTNEVNVNTGDVAELTGTVAGLTGAVAVELTGTVAAGLTGAVAELTGANAELTGNNAELTGSVQEAGN